MSKWEPFKKIVSEKLKQIDKLTKEAENLTGNIMKDPGKVTGQTLKESKKAMLKLNQTLLDTMLDMMREFSLYLNADEREELDHFIRIYLLPTLSRTDKVT